MSQGCLLFYVMNLLHLSFFFFHSGNTHEETNNRLDLIFLLWKNVLKNALYNEQI